MNNISVSVIVLTAISLAACAPNRIMLKKEGVSEQEARQDNAACENQSQMIQVADFAYQGSFMEGANIKQKQNAAMKNCLISKGYN